jgi:serine/threonine-protein kinase
MFREGDVLLEKYRVERVLGEGGMGIVVSAEHLGLGERVAIKFLRPSASTRPEALLRFQREGRAAARLKSEHVARVLDVGRLPTGEPYLVMEYLDGKDLGALLRERGRFSIEDAVELTMQACEALAEAHAAGVVHRDLKPGNLVLTQRSDGAPLVKIIDFGISKLAGSDGEMTESAVMMGSPLYTSPEQMESARDVDARADVWSLGVVLYALIAGSPPFKGTSVLQVHAAIERGAPSLRDVRPEVPEALSRVVSRCMQRDRDARIADVATLARQLVPFAPERAWSLAERAERVAAVATGRSIPPSSIPPRPGVVVESTEISGASAPRETSQPAAVSSAPSPQPAHEEIAKEPLPSISQTAAPRVHASDRPVASPRSTRLLVALGAAGAIAASLVAAWAHRSPPPAPAPPPSPLAAAKSALACPLLEASGVDAPSGWLGAAAASLACRRAAWHLGGDFERVRVPAELLHLPRQPGETFPTDPFVTDAASKTIAASAREADARLEGRVKKTATGAVVDLSLVDRAGNELGRAHGEAAFLSDAVALAVDELAARRVLPASPELEPEVAKWVGFHHATTGFAYDLLHESRTLSCTRIAGAKDDFGAFASAYLVECGDVVGTRNDVVQRLDRSSTAALAITSNVYVTHAPKAELDALAEELSALRIAETSPLGRSILAQSEARALASLGQIDRAKMALLTALRDGPLQKAVWWDLLELGQDAITVPRAAAAWLPEEADYQRVAALEKSLPIERRIALARRAFDLQGARNESGLELGRALLAAGRREEARAIAAAYIEGPKEIRASGDRLLAKIEESEGKFDAAYRRLAARSEQGTSLAEGLDVVEAWLFIADVLDRERAMADAWARHYVLDAERASRGLWVPGFEAFALVTCARASKDVATSCVSALRASRPSRPWDETSDALALGVERWIEGDARGAAAKFRGLVQSGAPIAIHLPAAVFDQAGELDLADAVDDLRASNRDFAGISADAPRRALRAHKRHEDAKAAEIAAQVLRAWAGVDVAVPSLARLRPLGAKR